MLNIVYPMYLLTYYTFWLYMCPPPPEINSIKKCNRIVKMYKRKTEFITNSVLSYNSIVRYFKPPYLT